MMRIAVAGGGGLGYLIAEELANTGNAYNVVVLSTRVSLFGPRGGHVADRATALHIYQP